MESDNNTVREARKLAAQRAAEYMRTKLREPGYHRRFKKKRNFKSKGGKSSKRDIIADTKATAGKVVKTNEKVNKHAIRSVAENTHSFLSSTNQMANQLFPYSINTRLIER